MNGFWFSIKLIFLSNNLEICIAWHMQLKKKSFFTLFIWKHSVFLKYLQPEMTHTSKNQHIYLKQTHMPTLLHLLECMIRHISQRVVKRHICWKRQREFEPFLQVFVWNINIIWKGYGLGFYFSSKKSSTQGLNHYKPQCLSSFGYRLALLNDMVSMTSVNNSRIQPE